MELGISSPLTQRGTCKFVRSWLVDTATIYRIGMTRTGVLVLVHAVGNVTIGGTLMALNSSDPWSGLGLWTGLPMLVCGVVCVILRRKRPESKISPLSTVCLIGFLASVVSMVTATISLSSLPSDPFKYYPQYRKTDFITPLYVLNGVLLALAPASLLFTFWALCLSVGYVWPCFRQSGTSIFTIMVEEEPMDRALVNDSDTELASLSVGPGSHGNTRGILQIQTDWVQQNPPDTAVSR